MNAHTSSAICAYDSRPAGSRCGCDRDVPGGEVVHNLPAQGKARVTRSDFGEDEEFCRGKLRTGNCSGNSMGLGAPLPVGTSLDGRSIRLLPVAYALWPKSGLSTTCIVASPWRQ
jgi:hypothetical protein